MRCKQVDVITVVVMPPLYWLLLQVMSSATTVMLAVVYRLYVTSLCQRNAFCKSETVLRKICLHLHDEFY